MHKKQILIADDDAITRHILLNFLKSEKEYSIKVVENACDCLDYIKNNTVDLLISDVEMDDLTGLEVSSLLACKTETSRIPVILLSIYDEIDISRKSQQYKNIKKVVQKPYDRNMLLSDIKEILVEKEKA